MNPQHAVQIRLLSCQTNSAEHPVLQVVVAGTDARQFEQISVLALCMTIAPLRFPRQQRRGRCELVMRLAVQAMGGGFSNGAPQLDRNALPCRSRKSQGVRSESLPVFHLA